MHAHRQSRAMTAACAPTRLGECHDHRMALDPDVGLPTGAELEAIFDVLRRHAFTREWRDAAGAPRDGLGAHGDVIKVEIDETAIGVKAATQQLRETRPEAFTDAEGLFDALLACGPWAAYRGGQINLHSARRYGQGPTEDISGWIAIVEVLLIRPAG